MVDGEGGPGRRVTGTTVRECSECDRAVEHEVSILVEEGETRDDVVEGNEKFSRHPKLVYRCEACGRVARERI